MNKPELSDREAALVEAARRELAARASRGPPPGPPLGPAPAPGPAAAIQRPPATPAAPADAAARVAALMQAEQEQAFRRKKKLRQFGLVVPAVILIAALLWVATAIFRYIRM
jgi:hypothetical protein